MSRAERLLALMQALRRRRSAVAGRVLAGELGVSLRTLYRDIASLQAQGAVIEGEAGLGFVLREGFTLPPLMFTAEEVEALVLGARWVSRHGDEALADAAQGALARIHAVMPPDLRRRAEESGLVVAPDWSAALQPVSLALVRDAIEQEHALDISYVSIDGEASRRRIWPVALAYFRNVRIVVAWCTLRDGFRHFRADRIEDATDTGEGYPHRRATLLARWQAAERAAAAARDGRHPADNS